MPRISNRGPQGVAKLTEGVKNGKSFIQVAFEEGGKFYIAKTKDTCPPYVQNGVFFVSLSPDKKEIKNMRPLSGDFVGKVTSFVAREGEQPVPQTNTKCTMAL